MIACPSCKAKLGETAIYCRSCGKELPRDLQHYRPPSAPRELQPVVVEAGRDLQNPLPLLVRPLTVIGGAGVPLRQYDVISLEFDETGLVISSPATDGVFRADYATLRSVEISGPGTVQKGGGFIGGGIGAEGAITGIAVATVLNWLTTSSQTITFLQLSGAGWELWSLTNEYDPLTLRILLSPVFVRLPDSRS